MPLKLYYAPGACSLAPHIALCESKLSFEKEAVDLKAKKTAEGKEFITINPKGYVPVLALEEGQILTEVAVILQYIADQAPESGLAPPVTSFERYRLQEWLNFIGSELHKKVGAFFQADLPDSVKLAYKETLARRFEWLAAHLERNDLLMGNSFSVADAYLFTILRWTFYLKIDLTRWPVILRYFDRVQNFACVQTALAAEGLSK